TLRFRISGGIATFPGDAAERVDLLRKADEALYRSKRIGRNRISLPASSQMVTKTSHYSQIQLERLSELARNLDKSEAFLLREALDELLRKYIEGGD
ncbi:MAG: GGDEF domain-containing protein, partial [Anaerolineaceae bacterium]|nr:GGDEF domain-containing protein [Anaerolineaceae bacterium]